MKALAAVRAGYGALQLAAPGLLAGRLLGLRLDRRARLTVRILGAWHLAQACLTWPAPTAAVLALGAEVDVAHAASMVSLAVTARRWRRAALASAGSTVLVADGFSCREQIRQGAGRTPSTWPRCSPRLGRHHTTSGSSASS